MASSRNPLVTAFPYGLEPRREIALVEALDTAQKTEADLPSEDHAQMAQVIEVKEALMDAFESDQYGAPETPVVQPKYVDTRSSWSGLIDIVHGKAKLRPKDVNDERPRLAKELADVLFKEKNHAPKFLKLPAIDLWVEGQHKLRVIQKRFMVNIRKLGLEEDLQVISENHNDLGKALRITERPEPVAKEDKIHELREALRKKVNIFIIGLTNLKLKKPQWKERVDQMLAPLDEFRSERSKSANMHPRASTKPSSLEGNDQDDAPSNGGRTASAFSKVARIEPMATPKSFAAYMAADRKPSDMSQPNRSSSNTGALAANDTQAPTKGAATRDRPAKARRGSKSRRKSSKRRR